MAHIIRRWRVAHSGIPHSHLGLMWHCERIHNNPPSTNNAFQRFLLNGAALLTMWACALKRLT